MTTPNEEIKMISFVVKNDGHQLGVFRTVQYIGSDGGVLGFTSQSLEYSRNGSMANSKRLHPWKSTKRLSLKEKLFYGTFFNGTNSFCFLPELNFYWGEF